jgi:hypothetical protein
MSNLVPRDHNDLLPARRSTGRQLSRISNQSLVVQAAAGAREHESAYRVQQRIDNGYRLAVQTVSNAARLNNLVTQVSSDKPGLEVTLRSIEDNVAFASQSVIYQYMTR